jgi:folate-dependent phosphoribosylglycinamide formyltransferase PurN
LGRVDKFFVITDRACGIEDFCKSNKIPWLRIECQDNLEFSLRAKEQFRSFGTIDCVVLFFLRLISSQIHKTFPTFNIHPSLLPAFSGFNPLRNALIKKVSFIGATIHFVDDTIDNGRIVGQICNPVKNRTSEQQINTLSFLQKTYLLLLLLELIEKQSIILNPSESDDIFNTEMPALINANPCITDPALLNSFYKIQNREGIEVIQ